MTSTIYEICVPSFSDSNGDGFGDLPGITARLDYLSWLGITVLWLTPFYRTNFFDFGYDVVDHCAVDSRFGTLQDFDELLCLAHRLDIKIIIDFVPNHTSSSHPWFEESRSSLTNARRNWYLWRDSGVNGSPPSNWTNQYEQSTWTWDESTKQWYMHSFHETQPDLNWANEDVRRAMSDVLTFWLDRGVDGFRFDAMVHLVKDSHLRNNPPAPDKRVDDWPVWPMTPAYTQDQGDLQEVIKYLSAVVNRSANRIIVGENHLPVERLPLFHEAGISHPVNSQLLDLEWNPSNVRRIIDRYEGILPSRFAPNWVLGSHDNARVATLLGESRVRPVAMLQLTLRGTPLIYYGEELGLKNAEIKESECRDPLAILMPGKGLGRDGQRCPMPWDETKNGGFSTVNPWLPLGSDYRLSSIARQRQNHRSILMLYRRLIQLRSQHACLRDGTYRTVMQSETILAYLRQSETEKFLVAINFSDRRATADLQLACGQIVLSTELDRSNDIISGSISLRGNESILIRLSS